MPEVGPRPLGQLQHQVNRFSMILVPPLAGQTVESETVITAPGDRGKTRSGQFVIGGLVPAISISRAWCADCRDGRDEPA
jgi:hypothetical protein